MVEEDLADVADAASMVRLRTDDVVPVQVARKAPDVWHVHVAPMLLYTLPPEGKIGPIQLAARSSTVDVDYTIRNVK
jgi:hypothetical protein